MSNPYLTNYGATVGGLHTFRDLGLYPAKKFTLSPPQPRTAYVDLPGTDGALDLTEALTGSVRYQDREGTFQFTAAGPRGTWEAAMDRLLTAFHGREARVILDEAPDVYLTGRLTVSAPSWGKPPKFTVKGRFAPYRLDRFDSIEDWEWDSFNFETGVVREYGQIGVDGSSTLAFISSPMGGSPEFYAEDEGITVTVDGETYTIPLITWTVFPEIILPKSYDTVEMTFSGSGTVWVRYRGGRL